MDARAVQSALAPAGASAAEVAWLWWLMLGVCTTVFLLVVGAVLAALRHSHVHADRGQARGERRARFAVGAAVGVTVIVLVGLLVASIVTGRAIQAIDQRNAVALRITGYQWWWDVEYEDAVPARHVRTANELHLPVGRPARIALVSTDVIHSFWAPNLAGKIDLVPGRTNVLWLRADRAGVFRAQCAEFCGVQHAHMALDIVVQPPEEFDAWLDARRRPAPAPATASATRGRQLVEDGSCALCHRIAGTSAGGRTAPDLSHVASRLTLGAGTIPNRRDALIDWLENPQRVKPGNRMPPPGLSRADLDDVVAYMETLR